jgi:uncharacterized alkaline shock family protein YloU
VVAAAPAVGAGRPLTVAATDGPRIGSNTTVEAAEAISSPLGTITISNEVVAQIVSRTAAESYGVVAMAPRAAIGKLLPERPTRGIAVKGTPEGLRIDLHVVVEYGLNLAEVGTTIRSRVAYEVTRLTGLRVAAVEVHIDDVRRSK